VKRRRLGVALVAAAIALDAWACALLASRMGATNDLFPRWLGTRLWLERGWDPYGPEATAAIAAAMGSAPLGGDRFVFGFVYPGYVALLLAPLAPLPFEAAATVWLLLGQTCCIGGALLAWRAAEREGALPRANPLGALTAAALLPAVVLNELFLQFAGLVLLGLAAGWWLALRGRPRLGGAALALAAVKPTLGLAPLLALAACVGRGRRRLVVSGAVALVLLLVASLVALPAWPAAFFSSTLDYARAARPRSASALAASVAPPGAEPALGVAIAVVAGVAIVVGWLRSPRLAGDALAAGVLASTWLVPPLYEWNNVVLLLVLLPRLRQLRARGSTVFSGGVAAMVAASAVTAALYTRWPSETRLVWPLLALLVYVVPGFVRRGNHSVSASGPLPSLAASS